MIAHGFRSIARVPKRVGFAGRQYSATFSRQLSSSRRRSASVAAVVAAISLTALAAANHDGANNQNEPSSWKLQSSLSKSACEGTKTGITTFPETLLKYDHYNGVIVHLDWIFRYPHHHDSGDEDPERQQQLLQLYQEWTNDPDHFEHVLLQSLQKFREDGRKGIWIHLPRNMASVVPACIKHGFDFHSCQNHNRINAGSKTGSTTLILSHWLPTDIKSRLPLGPYFQAGVGCVVLHPNDCNKILVVQEVTGPAAARKLWKMPTGLIDPGEDISEAAQRELEEETGLLNSKCEGILAFRQAHGASAGRASSDLFFVCLLSLPPQQSSSSLDSLKAQEHEIADIRWMNVEDYCSQETWQKSPVYQELNQAILDAVESQLEGKRPPLVVPHQLPIGWLSGTNTVYRSSL